MKNRGRNARSAGAMRESLETAGPCRNGGSGPAARSRWATARDQTDESPHKPGLRVIPARWRAVAQFSRPKPDSTRSRIRSSLQWHEIAQHGRDELRDRRVDVHCPLHDRVWRFRIHDVEDAVNDLVSG